VNEDYEFTLLYDLYEERVSPTGEVEYTLKKRDCSRKWYISDVQNITDIREIPNKHGVLYKSKCEVYHRPELKWNTVKGNYHELKQLLKADRKKVTGFYGSK